MHRTKTLLATVALGALFIAPALAQQTTQPSTTAGPGRTAPPPTAALGTTAAENTATSTPMSSADTGHPALNGSLVKSHDQWGASG